MGPIAGYLRRLFTRRPPSVVEPHAFVASITMIPTTPSKGGPVAEPVTVAD